MILPRMGVGIVQERGATVMGIAIGADAIVETQAVKVLKAKGTNTVI